MKILYIIAWILIIGFVVWSANLLLEIQSISSKTRDLHQLSLHLDSLAAAWRDLNRPGNDVLEHYEVDTQRTALNIYDDQYEAVRNSGKRWEQHDDVLSTPLTALDGMRQSLVGLAKYILDVAAEREKLRLAQANHELISQKETTAAAAMAKMDQVFQRGLDLILGTSSIVHTRERHFESLQTRNFHLLYVMLVVTLLVSALSIELIRHTIRQREALRDSATRINAIVNNVVDGIVTTNNEGSIESINAPAEKMFGYSARDVVGEQFTVLLDEHCRDAYQAERRKDASQMRRWSAPDECENLGQRQDGSRFPIELVISPATLKGKQLLIHIVRDVTHRRQSDQKLRLAASVFENTSEGIIVTDVNGNIQSVNPAFTAISQYPAKEVIGKNPKVLKSGKQDQEFYRRMWNSIQSTGHWQGEIWNRRKNGEIYPQWLTISAIKDHRGRTTNYVGVAWDISELKESERKKEEFIATVSHELRTPLTSVLGSLGLVMGTMHELMPEPARRLVAMAHSNSRRMVRLISDLLDIQKIEAGKMTFEFEPVELTALVLRIVEDNTALAEQSNITLTANSQTKECWVNGDGDRLMQAMANLIVNAIKFSPPGQSVEIDVGEYDRMIRVAVTDHGPGISNEFRDEVFKKFAQGDETGLRHKGGTGLGLSIAKLIVQAHGGLIDYDSTPGECTTFFIALPVLDDAMARTSMTGAYGQVGVSTISD